MGHSKASIGFFFFLYNPKASIGRHALRKKKSIICEYMNAL